MLLTKNSGLPTKRKLYGNGAVIIGLRTKGQQRTYDSKLTAVSNDEKSLESSILFDEYNKCKNAFEVLTELFMLYASYWKIRSKPGNMAPSINKVTLDGIDDKYFLELHNNLRNEIWRPKPSKRIYIKNPMENFAL